MHSPGRPSEVRYRGEIPLDVPASCFLPVTDSLWFNVLVLTEVYCFTLAGLYLGSNLVRSWQYKKTRRRMSCVVLGRA